MKRVRGPDETAPPSAATSKHTGSGGAGSSGGGGPVVTSGSGAGGTNIEYHSSSGIPVSAQVRSVPPKDMPSSIQFSQNQQHYPGAIVVPTAAPSPIKVHIFIHILPSLKIRIKFLMFFKIPS